MKQNALIAFPRINVMSYKQHLSELEVTVEVIEVGGWNASWFTVYKCFFLLHLFYTSFFPNQFSFISLFLITMAFGKAGNIMHLRESYLNDISTFHLWNTRDK